MSHLYKCVIFMCQKQAELEAFPRFTDNSSEHRPLMSQHQLTNPSKHIYSWVTHACGAPVPRN